MTRVGIIGYGIMGQMFHQGCAQYPGADVSAVCNRSSAKLEQARSKGVKQTFQDYHEMLTKAKPDAMYVALPDRLHRDVVVDCLQAGCDVLVEKPMAANLKEALEMQELAQKAKRKLMTNFSFRWEVDFQQMKDSVAAGKLGKLSYMFVRVSDIRAVPLQWLSWGGQSSPSEFLLPHSIDLARWVSGQEITRVYATKGEGVLRSNGVDTHDFMVALCELSGGMKLCLETSWILPDTHPTPVDFYIEVQGAEGAMRLDRKETGICSYTAEKAQRPITWLATLSSGKGVGFFYESVNNFLDWITGKIEQPMSTADDGVRATAVLEAILRSATLGQPVSVESV